jgi:hypothetical protein
MSNTVRGRLWPAVQQAACELISAIAYTVQSLRADFPDPANAAKLYSLV